MDARDPGRQSSASRECPVARPIPPARRPGALRPRRPKALLRNDLRPSDVVAVDYARTRAWARRIYEHRHWARIRWWSYYDPRWASAGLWSTGRLILDDVEPLRLDHPAVLEAARIIFRRIVVTPTPR